jgi:hypothetical protein
VKPYQTGDDEVLSDLRLHAHTTHVTSACLLTDYKACMYSLQLVSVRLSFHLSVRVIETKTIDEDPSCLVEVPKAQSTAGGTAWCAVGRY